MYEKLLENMKQIIIGKERVLKRLIIALLAEGHVLIEDVPGVGKTTAAQAMAKSMALSFKRIQFTPDLLPSDILGISIYDKANQVFRLQKGPIFNQVILADEINRASPKTQSSLLEVMEERQVTIDGQTHVISKPFMVIATQNPVEYGGTFPLPEAQLDRFLMRIQVGYPDKSDEIKIIKRMGTRQDIKTLEAVLSQSEIVEMQNQVKSVYIEQSLVTFIADIVGKTRNSDEILLGCSPRASLGLLMASKARAFIHNRSYVLPEDIRILAPDVLAHRLILNPEVRYRGRKAVDVVRDLLEHSKVPKVQGYE